jgi:tetratricopeptide (TPR) repeat protein
VIGWTIFCRGDLAGAQRKYEESRSILREIIGYDYGSSWLGDKQASVLTARDNLEGAKKLQEESLQAVKRLENPRLAAQLYSRLAETLLEQEHPSDAVKMAASAIQEAKAARDLQLESVAHAVLAEALLAQGSIPEAKKEIAQALSRVAEFQWWHRIPH